ncbi:MAG: DUF1295 domain-containing protein [Bacteroidales bacterium]
MTETLSLLGTAWAAVAVLMAVLWVIHLRIGNAAIVDAGWAYGLPLAALVYAADAPQPGARLLVLVAMFVVWGGRLGTYLLMTRVVGHAEEGRYQALRRRWRTSLPLKFFLFFQAQAVLGVLLSLPALLVARSPVGAFSAVEAIGLVLWAVGVAGETTADAQLARFKRVPANRGRTCRAGLWRYSRHPNYFFEWLVWVAYAVYALGSPYGWLALSCPALMLYFLFRVTGIPATEDQALRTRGDDYRRYQQTTSAFVPWFPRRRPHDHSR